MITSLNLINFRGFEELSLEGLQRVNLIVGRNNSGKTSLLESILVLANPSEAPQMGGIFRTPSNNFLRWLMRDGKDVLEGSITGIVETQSRKVDFFRPNAQQRPNKSGVVRVVQAPDIIIDAQGMQKTLSAKVVALQALNADQIVKLFGTAVARKGGEERMDALFRHIDNRIRKVRLISSKEGLHIRFDFNLSEMIPLSEVGQGVSRLITIFSELIAERSDIYMIDEIENGIHHSVLEQVWSGVAVAAESLNTQIFATTHSYECIQAAHCVFSKRASYDFSIIQLFRADEGLRGRVLDKKHIEAALLGDIDLR